MASEVQTATVEPKRRPVGMIAPTHDRATRALIALADDRLRDARMNIDAMPRATATDRAWCRLIAGMVALHSGRFSEAEDHLLVAAGSCALEQDHADGRVGRDVPRLRALCWHHLGRTYRRQDDLDRAVFVHESAYRIRHRHGAPEELAESAVELGMDADVLGLHEDAQDWYHRALDWAKQATEDPLRIQALIWTKLVSSFMGSGHGVQAVEAAGHARDCWRQHDITSADCARADMVLAGAQLKLAETLHDTEPASAAEALQIAIDGLGEACESLLAFGEDQMPHAKWCADQKDFAERLLASLG